MCVCDLRRHNIQKPLWTQGDLTLVKAVEIAVSLEITSRDEQHKSRDRERERERAAQSAENRTWAAAPSCGGKLL